MGDNCQFEVDHSSNPIAVEQFSVFNQWQPMSTNPSPRVNIETKSSGDSHGGINVLDWNANVLSQEPYIIKSFCFIMSIVLQICQRGACMHVHGCTGE